MHFLRALIRLILFAVITSCYIAWIILKAKIKGTDLHHGLRVRQRWVKRMLPFLGVQIQVEGPMPTGASLIVSNHRSYFDPIALLENTLALPLSKSEVRKWPIIGIGAEVTGTLFVERSNPQNRRNVQLEIAKTIKKKKYPVILYAEGTTHDKPTTIPFKAGAFIMAARGKLPVIPVAIDYLDLKDAWIGDDTFVPHFFRTFGKRRTYIRLSYGPPIYSDDHHLLRDQTSQWIDEEMLRFRREWEAGASAGSNS